MIFHQNSENQHQKLFHVVRVKSDITGENWFIENEYFVTAHPFKLTLCVNIVWVWHSS
jgi:hypothetical protein